jgi:hypothetical protein
MGSLNDLRIAHWDREPSGTAFGVLSRFERHRRSPLALRPPATICQPSGLKIRRFIGGFLCLTDLLTRQEPRKDDSLRRRLQEFDKVCDYSQKSLLGHPGQAIFSLFQL